MGFLCPKCARKYKSQTALKFHVRNECGKEPIFPCPFCSVKMKLKGNLKRHINTLHKVEAGVNMVNDDDDGAES